MQSITMDQKPNLTTTTVTNNNNNKRKQSMGRRKIEIKKIEKISSRQVTFSKRRLGLFRKASELCLLTGAEVAIFIVSSKDKVFTFCHPTVESIINRYEQGTNNNSNSIEGFDYIHSALFSEIQERLDQLRLMEAERDRVKAMVKKGSIGNGKSNEGYWWNKNTDGMGLEELERFRDGLEELRGEVKKKADEKAMLRRSIVCGNEELVSVPYDFGFRFHMNHIGV